MLYWIIYGIILIVFFMLVARDAIRAFRRYVIKRRAKDMYPAERMAYLTEKLGKDWRDG